MLSLVNEYVALLDTCTLYPIAACDLLLYLAKVGMFTPKWSEDILEELRRSLIANAGLSAEKGEYRIACMASAYPEAHVSGHESLVPSMMDVIPDEKDRHVLAGAVLCKADALVTFNLKHFPVELCLSRFSIEVLTPDEFLVHQYHLDNDLVIERVQDQIVRMRKPADAHLSLLRRMFPNFVELVKPRIVGQTS